MGDKTGILLPKGFEVRELFSGPSFEDGDEILRNYCRFCQLKDSCEMTRDLRYAMGNDIPYWSGAFVPVKTEVPAFPIEPDSPWVNLNSSDTEWYLVEKNKIFCTEYKHRNPQLYLQGVPPFRFLEGVERLVAVVKEETERVFDKFRDLNERGISNSIIIREEKERILGEIKRRKSKEYEKYMENLGMRKVSEGVWSNSVA